jgi:AbiV family abortive infection protein
LAALDNAERLAQDAEMLLREGRYPTAHALAVLALEEYGKHILCASATIRGHADPSYWRKFRRRFNSHRDKLRNALLLTGLLAKTEVEMEPLDDLEAAARRRDFAKLRGLYVDIDRGRVLDPTTTIAPKDAEETIAAVTRLLKLGRLVFAGQAEVVQRVFADAAERARELAQESELIADDPIPLIQWAESMRRRMDSSSTERDD